MALADALSKNAGGVEAGNGSKTVPLFVSKRDPFLEKAIL
jgi:hypothetical protein